MTNIVFCLLLACIGFSAAVSPVSQTDPAQFKIAFDFNQIEIFKNDVLKPFIQEMPNLGLNWDLPVNLSGVTGNISNLTVMNVTLDWDNTHLLTRYDTTAGTVGFAVEIMNLSACVKYDAKLRYDKLPYATAPDNYLTIESMDLFLVFGFVVSDDEYYTYIETASVVMQDFSFQLSGIFSVISDVLKPLESEIAKILSGVATKEIQKYNQTLIAQSAYGVGATLFDTLQVNLTFASQPTTFLVSGEYFASMAFNLDVMNIKTGQAAPLTSSDDLINYVNGGLPIQFIIGEQMIYQLTWALFQSGKLNLTVSDANTPSAIPVHLYTSDLIILFPNITQDWGQNKGCYINIQAGEAEPVVFIRDGRLVLDVAVNFTVYVDKDSSQYPKQGLANCTTCEKAFSLDMTVFVAVDIYGVNQTAIGARVLDINMNGMTLTYGDVDAAAFQRTLNGLLGGITQQLNEQVATIVIPYIQLVELYGLDDISLFLGPGFLQFGLSVVPKNTTTFLPF